MREPLIMGKNCLKEVLKAKPKRIQKIFAAKESDPIVRQARSIGISIQLTSKERLSAMVGSESHQGIVARLKERPFLDFKQLLKEESSLIVMCDGITDPQNFGAILRSAECFGVNAVIFSKNRSVEVTPVVTKASVGASELVPLVAVSNLAEAVSRLKEAGYQVIATDVSEKAEELSSCTFSEKTVLILGAEGKGIQPLLKKRADRHVMIPLSGQITSLNVAQATSILLYSIVHG